LPKGGHDMATADNLKEAFAGESQANRTYLAFAKKADKDGLAQIAKLFRAAAAAETVHAHAHLKAMGGVKGTAENLQAAINGEGFEFQEMYPKFLAEAEEEGAKAAVTSFEFAMAVEEIHHGLYGKALETLEAGGDMEAAPISVCPVCGNTFVGDAPDKCPICATPKKMYMHIE